MGRHHFRGRHAERLAGIVKPAWVVTIIALSTLLPSVQAGHGRFLPDPGPDNFIMTWSNLGGGALPYPFNRTVRMGTTPVGMLLFDYDTFLGKGPAAAGAGAALSGGFYLSKSFAVMPGYTLEWVQTVEATRTGRNPWGLDPTKNGGEFPDATPQDRMRAPIYAPSYALITTAVSPPTPNPGFPTLGFQDTSFRHFANGAQSWQAELGLVAIQNTAVGGVRKVDVIDTFTWGYFLTTPPNDVEALVAGSFGPPSASYLQTLTNYYSTGKSPGGKTTSKYTFTYDPNVFVAVTPEPPSLLLLGLGILPLLARVIFKKSTA